MEVDDITFSIQYNISKSFILICVLPKNPHDLVFSRYTYTVTSKLDRGEVQMI